MSEEETKTEEQVEETTMPATPKTDTPETETPTQNEEENETPAFQTKLINLGELRTGQTIRIHERIKDVSPKGEERERIQVFEGIIIAFGGKGISRTITVRKTAKGYGVEKIYPINSPVIAKIELVKTAKVRQAKLGYLRELKRRFKRRLKETYTELGTQQKKK